MSLFAVISAVATDRDRASSTTATRTVVDEVDDGADDPFELALAPPPPLTGGVARPSDGAPTRRDEKRLLRDENARLARELARRTGLTHAEVNAELNRRSADSLAVRPSTQHRTDGQCNRGYVDRRRGHEAGGRGLVAAHREHDAIDRVAIEQFHQA